MIGSLLFRAAFAGVVIGGLGAAGGYLATRDAPLARNAVADLVVIEKARRTLTLFSGGAPLKTYGISLGFGGPGPKRREGDGKTPEGRYSVAGRKSDSVAHLALRVSYPEPRDIAASSALGVPPGGLIEIHGLRNGLGWLGPLHRLYDWTDGCIAVTDAEMDEIWRATPDGTPIDIRP